MAQNLRNACAIVGVGETAIGKLPGRTALDLQVEAIKLALDDAGLALRDVDGLMTPDLRFNPYRTKAPVLAEYLGLEIPVAISWPWGGIAGAFFVVYAAALISAGLCNTVVLAAGEPMRTAQGQLRQKISLERGASHPDFELPYGPLIPTAYALIARRHMYEYGTTSEQLANITVTFRNHAMLHPRAQMRTPITVEDVLASPMVSSPLHRLDCSIVSDGAWAIVITSAERARDLRQKPVYLLGAGQAHGHMHVSFAHSLTEDHACIEAGRAAFQMAGVGPKDIAVLGLYDSFTITVVLQLEDLGFCKKGEGGPFVQSGRLGIGGEFPTNTHGGLLSHAHAGRTANFPHIVEMAQQLRGQAGARQIKNARLGLVQFSAHMYSAHCTLILAS